MVEYIQNHQCRTVPIPTPLLHVLPNILHNCHMHPDLLRILVRICKIDGKRHSIYNNAVARSIGQEWRWWVYEIFGTVLTFKFFHWMTNITATLILSHIEKQNMIWLYFLHSCRAQKMIKWCDNIFSTAVPPNAVAFTKFDIDIWSVWPHPITWW